MSIEEYVRNDVRTVVGFALAVMEAKRKARNERAKARRFALRNHWRYNRRTGFWYKNVFRDGRTEIIRIKNVLEIIEWEADEAATLRARVQAEKNRRRARG